MMLLITMTLLLSSCAKYRLDAQVRELCAKDGGIRVYETVKLPPDKFDKYGNINFYRATQGENALGPEYIYIEETHYFVNEPPAWHSNVKSVRREYTKIIRVADMKLLGEWVSYHRIGGEWPGPFHPSTFSCPDTSGLFSSVYINENIQ